MPKNPAGVRKSRAPAKKKPSPVVAEELGKSTDIIRLDGHENDSKPVPIDPELYISAVGGAVSPSKGAFEMSETASPLGVLKTGETSSTRGRGGKKKNVRFDIPDD
ncbi:hypothetical protein ACJ72_06029 [Emergomyces africanus]|uniref:Uncharacterized protein n=1 Tax=Emergomyces africanus TaxID=1955775 RepID=A0A1B7NS89_9EURO|nr:hypothetical protein ACJ72_06029 [Emergomyces africanus]